MPKDKKSTLAKTPNSSLNNGNNFLWSRRQNTRIKTKNREKSMKNKKGCMMLNMLIHLNQQTI